MKVNIVCPNGRTLPFIGSPSAPIVRFNRWRDLLALPFWPTLVFGNGYAKKRILVSDEHLDAILAGGGNSSRVIGWWLRFWALWAQLPSLRRRSQRRDIEAHYSRSNQYYRLQLSGQTGRPADEVGRPGDMVYSCARPMSARGSLGRAQLRKLLDIYLKLGLFDKAPETLAGSWLLDIGCGWGDLAVLAAKLFGINVLGITLSQAQLDRARALARSEGVDHLVKFELMNYRDLPKLTALKFRWVTSVGMFEHVGRRQQRLFFRVVRQMLAPGGVALLHCIVRQVPGPVDLWVRKKIFPHGHLAAGYQIDRQLARHGLFTAQVDYLWEEYAITLEHWLEVHLANRDQVIAELGEEFYLERLLWLRGCVQAFRQGGPAGALHQGLKVGQWLFTYGKPRAGTWSLGHRVNTALLEHMLDVYNDHTVAL